MSGIAALAAAAAATQKITTTQGSVPTTPTTPGIKVVTPTIVTPSGIKVTPVQGRQGNLYWDKMNISTEFCFCIE